jgi:hypothetical protein
MTWWVGTFVWLRKEKWYLNWEWRCFNKPSKPVQDKLCPQGIICIKRSPPSPSFPPTHLASSFYDSIGKRHQRYRAIKEKGRANLLILCRDEQHSTSFIQPQFLNYKDYWRREMPGCLWIISWNECGEIRSRPIWRHYPRISLGGSKENNTSVRIVGLGTKVRNWDLSNTGIENKITRSWSLITQTRWI